jgi:hypothetical protein
MVYVLTVLNSTLTFQPVNARQLTPVRVAPLELRVPDVAADPAVAKKDVVIFDVTPTKYRDKLRVRWKQSFFFKIFV